MTQSDQRLLARLKIAYGQPHCESCGRTNYETDDDYTQCCNEPVCYGSPEYRFGTPNNFVIACCWARAEPLFAGEIPPDSERMGRRRADVPRVDQVLREIEAMKKDGYEDLDALLAVREKYPAVADAAIKEAREKRLLDV